MRSEAGGLEEICRVKPGNDDGKSICAALIPKQRSHPCARPPARSGAGRGMARREHALSRRRRPPARPPRRARGRGAMCRSSRSATCSITRRSGARCRTSSPASATHRHPRRRRPPARSQCRAPPQIGGRDGAPVPRRPGGGRARRCACSSAAASRSTSLPTNIPTKSREGFATPQEALVAFAEEGARRRYPHGVPPKVRHALDHELRAHRRTELRALFPHRARHRALCPRAGHPLPGPRLGRELRRLLLPRRHRGRSRALRSSVRAFRLGRAARAARHRRRFRARAARGGDPVHLSALRARPRRPRRDRDLLSRAQRHPRRRQGLRPVGRRDRRARRHAVGLVAGGDLARACAPRRLRSRRCAPRARRSRSPAS